MDKREIQLLTRAYGVLADIRNDWPGRNTAMGQRMLGEMRDTIADWMEVEPQWVQDNFGRSDIIGCDLAARQPGEGS